jgi:hypothetical protein
MKFETEIIANNHREGILAIGEVGDKTGGDRPREHCTSLSYQILCQTIYQFVLSDSL